MKKLLTWIVLCNIFLMGLNVILLFSKNANAAPNLQAEVQATLENRIIFLEKQYQALDARLREVELLLGFAVVENSIPIVNNESSRSEVLSDLPEQAAPTAPSQLPKASLIYRSNARYGPNTNYPIAINLVAGETVDIIGYNNDSGTIWYKMASGSWLAAFLVQNAPGSIPYIPAPSPEEIEIQRASDLPVDAKSDPPILPSASPNESSSSLIQPAQPDAVIQNEAVVNEGKRPELGAISATSSSTGTSAEILVETSADVDGVVATAQITEQTPLSETTQNVRSIVDSEPVSQSVGRVTKSAFNCAGGCTEYPAWCDPPIKGHITFDADEKIYYMPGQLEYENINMDIRYGERWFCSIKEAVAEGWRAP